MARPANPLDKYVTYTYHFELHAADSLEKLRQISSTGVNAPTKRNEPNGTLLINTRMDAHQHINSVTYEYIGPGAEPGSTLAPFTVLTMVIEEPGSAFFFEKIQRAIIQHKCTDIGSLVFGLKILFIGRTADDQEEIYDKIPLMPLQMINFSAEFTFKGGVYTALFANAGTSAVVSNPYNPNTSYAYTHKGFSIEANTLREAFGELETALNTNYTEWYSNQTNRPAGKLFSYQINVDPAIDGAFQTGNKVSTAAGTKSILTFEQSMQIVDMVHRCIMHCPDVMEKIKASKDKFMKPLHQDAFAYTVVPRVDSLDGGVEVVFSVERYSGATGPEDQYEFNFYFSGAGQNVDVLGFDMKMEKSLVFFMGGSGGDDYSGNFSGQLPLVDPFKWSRDVVHSDQSVPRDRVTEDKRQEIHGTGENDHISPPATPRSDNQAHNSQQIQNVNTVKGAMDALSLLVAASGSVQKTLRIRGHAGLLLASWMGPDASNNKGFGVNSGLWVKVNIYDEDGRQFFYRDYYWTYSVKNTFSGGQFIQDLVLITMPKQLAGDQPQVVNQAGVNSNVRTSVPNTAAADIRRVENNLAEAAKTKQDLANQNGFLDTNSPTSPFQVGA